MKTITTVIATTLPDINLSKFTHHVLPSFMFQINHAKEKLLVVDSEGKEVGKVISGKMNFVKQLTATMEIDTDLIDTGWEYFFVPNGRPIVEPEQQGKFTVITEAIIESVLITKNPTDLSLKPFVFEIEFKEGTDYLVMDYSDLKAGEVPKLLELQLPVYVYYPPSTKQDEIIKDATEKGIIKDNKVIFPFEIKAFPGTIENFKNKIKSVWKKFAMERMENPLKSPKEIQ